MQLTFLTPVPYLTCCGGGSLPRLVRRLRMLLSDICRRADTGGILDSMLGSRVTSAFMSLRSSSSWFSTVRAREHALSISERVVYTYVNSALISAHVVSISEKKTNDSKKKHYCE